MAEESGDGDLLVALISGGGSSLAELPMEGLDMDDLLVVAREMMEAGAPIEELNCVRRHLSRIKNGGLLEAAGSMNVVSLLISDVVDSPPNVIASGPTMADETTAEQALRILEQRLGPRLSPTVRSALTRPAEVPPSGADHTWTVIANGETAAAAAASTLESAGVLTTITTTLRGEAWKQAQSRVMNCTQGVSIFAGETTVSGATTGKGGRNQEAALAAAIAIAGRPGYTFAAFGTDGIDGPTDAAGAIVDSETVARGDALGLDAALHLESHDSNPFLAATGDLVTTGPTGTNVGDLWFVSSP
jgi:hydroxypyruvate reductase